MSSSLALRISLIFSAIFSKRPCLALMPSAIRNAAASGPRGRRQEGMTDRGWLTIAEACRVLKVSRRTLYTHMETGRIPFYQAGGSGHRRIKPEDLELLMLPGASPSVQSPPPPANNVEEDRSALIAALEHEQLERQQRDQGLCWQSAQVGQIRTREDYYYEELRGSSLRVLL